MKQAEQSISARRRAREHKRFEKRVRKADQTRTRLLEDGKLSLASGLGKLVIVVSNRQDWRRALLNPADEGRDVESFMEEAEQLREERRGQHQAVIIRRKAVASDIKLDLADKNVTDMALIGHGSINDLWIDAGGGHFDWHDVARAATGHLKQGRIEQRICGNFPRAHNVALGSFAVSRLSNVLAATNTVVPDFHPEDGLFQPVYNDEEDLVRQIFTLNERHAKKQPSQPELAIAQSAAAS